MSTTKTSIKAATTAPKAPTKTKAAKDADHRLQQAKRASI
jgi:hypothetical protein